MQFRRLSSRQKPESIVPMINVVFLLLIFFMMTATIKQKTPFDVTPPNAQRDSELQENTTLFISADGRVGMTDFVGDSVWQQMAETRFDGSLTIRADANLSAQALSKIFARLTDFGVTEIELVVAQE